MMSDHGANPIFFNKIQQRLEIQNTCYPPPTTTNNILILPYYPPTPQSGYHMCIKRTPNFFLLIKHIA